MTCFDKTEMQMRLHPRLYQYAWPDCNLNDGLDIANLIAVNGRIDAVERWR